jgi:hypothetical protein
MTAWDSLGLPRSCMGRRFRFHREPSDPHSRMTSALPSSCNPRASDGDGNSRRRASAEPPNPAREGKGRQGGTGGSAGEQHRTLGGGRGGVGRSAGYGRVWERMGEHDLHGTTWNLMELHGTALEIIGLHVAEPPVPSHPHSRTTSAPPKIHAGLAPPAAIDIPADDPPPNRRIQYGKGR